MKMLASALSSRWHRLYLSTSPREHPGPLSSRWHRLPESFPTDSESSQSELLCSSNFDMRGDVDQPPLARPTLESTQAGTEKALSRPPQTLEELSRPPKFTKLKERCRGYPKP